MKRNYLATIVPCFCFCLGYGQNWPQASGPQGDWSVRTTAKIPTTFNVATSENILWKKPLPEGGQSGIAAWGDRLFLTIMKPYGVDGQDAKTGAVIIALCLDATNGEVIWQHEVTGTRPSGYMSGFSDSSSPTPVTDGEHVWITNASGTLVCLNWQGEVVWQRTWRLATDVLKPAKDFPFNKQFEPFMVGDTFVNMEPYDRDDGERTKGWHYLFGLDKNTGEVKWVSEDALTHYNTPCYSPDALGKPTVLIGRGGYHAVPETPKGYSMIDLANGRRIWQREFTGAGDTALCNSAFTSRFAVWFSETDSKITVLNSQNGEILRTIDLRTKVDLRTFDQILGQYVLKKDFDLGRTPNPNVFPAWYTNIIVGDHLYFMCFKDDTKEPLMKKFMNLSPRYCFARVNLTTAKVEYLEVPAHIDDRGQPLWREELKTTALNSRGFDTITDQRSKRDGWYWCFNGNPIRVNDTLYFTTMIGNCYTFDASAGSFDEKAFLSVNPLGVRGESWSLNTPTFAHGKLYHRTMKELICVGYP